MSGITTHLYKTLINNPGIYNNYHTLQKNWPLVDKLVLDLVKNTPSDRDRLLDAEEWMWAFNGRLRTEARTARSAYRWLDPPELQSYLRGTFESKAKAGCTRRGFKALSMNPNLNFESRKVMLEVPLGTGLRKSLRCTHYTVLPRDIRDEDERILDPKNAEYVKEAEVRVPDGTAIPPTSIFTVKPEARADPDIVAALGELYTVHRALS